MINIDERKLEASEMLIYAWTRETHGPIRLRAVALFFLLYLVKAITQHMRVGYPE
jgi:hypothetical protein